MFLPTCLKLYCSYLKASCPNNNYLCAGFFFNGLNTVLPIYFSWKFTRPVRRGIKITTRTHQTANDRMMTVFQLRAHIIIICNIIYPILCSSSIITADGRVAATSTTIILCTLCICWCQVGYLIILLLRINRESACPLGYKQYCNCESDLLSF